ncbi:MAG: hypothetical protein ACPG52_05425 [Cognaticolwellia sp.]
MRKFLGYIFFFSVLIVSDAVYAQSVSGTPVIELSMPTSLHFALQYIFIGSGLILSLMCFAWAQALRSYSMTL